MSVGTKTLGTHLRKNVFRFHCFSDKFPPFQLLPQNIILVPILRSKVAHVALPSNEIVQQFRKYFEEFCLFCRVSHTKRPRLSKSNLSRICDVCLVFCAMLSDIPQILVRKLGVEYIECCMS